MMLIAGSGRSGTTWILDALAEANGLRPVFEPLHPAVSIIGSRYAYRALLEGDDHPELKQYLSEVSVGRRDRIWVKYRGRPDLLFPHPRRLRSGSDFRLILYRWRKFCADFPTLHRAGGHDRPLVKCIRANLMLGWLARHCDCRTVLVIRHPGAVVASQLTLGNVWDPLPTLNRYRNDERLRQLSSGRYDQLLNRSLNVTEALTLNWVIENQVPLARASFDRVTVVCYERLRSHSETEWPRLAKALGLDKVPAVNVQARSSQQTYGTSKAIPAGRVSEPHWLRTLSREQVRSIESILRELGFEVYSMSSPDPVPPQQAMVAP